MAQRTREIQLQAGKETEPLTSWGGVLPLLALYRKTGIAAAVDRTLGLRPEQGYPDSFMIGSLMLLSWCGYDAPEQIRFLEGDTGLAQLLRERRDFGTERFRRETGRTFPSATAIRTYLHEFTYEGSRVAGAKTVIPVPGQELRCMEALIGKLLSLSKETVATLDQDVTYIETARSEEARYSYKGERSVEAFVSLWSEADLVVDIQVRSGNVSPKSDQLARLKESLSRLPESVKKVSLRSDSAGYQEEVLRYCAEGRNERFGVIEFAISCPVWKEFHREAIRLPEEAWKVVEGTTDREYAEVPFVPDSLGTSASGPDYRYIALRRKLADAERLKEKAVEMQGQRYLFDDTELSRLHATEFPGGTYAIFGLVTNRTGMDGSELVHWHDARCGKGEQIHDDLKNGLGMGHVTSVELGSYAAWVWIQAFAYNLCSIFRHRYLRGAAARHRPTGLRNALFAIAGRVIRHAGKIIVRLSGGHPYVKLLTEAFSKIRNLVPAT